MTREEMLDGLYEIKNWKCNGDAKTHEVVIEAIKALEQESCEDAISRQAAQAKIKNICDEYRLSYEDGERKAATGGSAYALGHAFDDLPPVNPNPKTGKWIDLQLIPNDITGHTCGECSECHKVRIVDKYCPNCGCRMIEPQESEDKE